MVVLLGGMMMNPETIDTIVGEILRTKDEKLVKFLNDNNVYLAFKHEGIQWKYGRFED